ncbi:transglycosylase SLT domain-containing protein [bacterium]|nr:transglycosylase SLT domain-containing protein [bacterium]
MAGEDLLVDLKTPQQVQYAGDKEKTQEEQAQDASLMAYAPEIKTAEDFSAYIQTILEGQDGKSLEDLEMFDNVIQEIVTLASQSATPSNMEDGELAALFTDKIKTEGNIITSQDDIIKIFMGTFDDELQSLQEVFNGASEKFNELLEMKAQTDENFANLKDNLDNINLEIASQENYLMYYDSQISDTDVKISKQNEAIKSIDTEIKSYDKTISNLKDALLNCSDEQYETILKKIDKIEEEKGKAETRKSNEEAVLKTLNEKLDLLKTQHSNIKNNLEGENGILQQRANIENMISEMANGDDEFSSALKTLQETKEVLDNLKSDMIEEYKNQINQYCINLSDTEENIAQRKAELFEEAENIPIEQQTEELNTNVYSSPSGGYSAGGYSNVAKVITREDLEKNYNEANEKLGNNRNQKLEILKGNNPKLNKIQEMSDTFFEALLSKLKEDDEDKTALEEKRTKLENSKEKSNTYDANIATLENTIADLNTKLQGFDIQLEKLLSQKSSLEALKSDIDQDKKAEFEENFNALLAQIEKLQNDKKTLEEEISTKEKELEDTKKEKENLDLEIENLNSEIQELIEKIQTKLNEKIQEENDEEPLEIDYDNITQENIENMSFSQLAQYYIQSQNDYSDVKNNLLAELNSQNKALQTSANEAYKTLSEKVGQELANQFGFSGSIPHELAVRLDNDLGSGFCAKLTQICKEINCDPNDLLGMMQSESGLNPKAYNPNGGASGLIQFMPSTAKSLGTTTEALRSMSAIQQLDYVKTYFMNWKGSRTDKLTAGDLYSYCFLPAVAGNEVLCTTTDSLSWAYKANSGFDTNKDGKITKTELTQFVQNNYKNLLGKYGLS